MCSSEDCEKLWFLYKLEGEPNGMSIEQFCIKQGVPYQVFNKWFRDRKKRIVPVEIVGRDEDTKSEVEEKESKGLLRLSHYPPEPDSGIYVQAAAED